MAKYRNKPRTIEAVQFDPQVQPWPDGAKPWPKDGYQPRDMSFGYVNVYGGDISIFPGDWIITDDEGKHYICKPDVFAAVYEAVPE